MDGIEVLKRIRQLEDNPNQKIPVIALTANAISGAREKFLAEGFDDYITKPVDGTRLEKMLMVYLPAGKIKLNASPEPEDIGAGEDAETASSGNGDGTVNATDAGGKAGVKDSGSCIDYDAGIANCGSEEIYRSILQIFIDDIDNKTSAIRQSLENNDIKRYTVEVHALKSSARTVGAMEVSKLAAELEDAGERSDMERINADTERLLTMFAGCRSAAKGLDIFNSAEAGQTAGKREKAQSGMSETIANEIGRDVWKDALETIKEFAQLMDYDNAAMILGSLRDYDMSDDNKKHITELRNLVDGLKWENVIEKIDGILSEM